MQLYHTDLCKRRKKALILSNECQIAHERHSDMNPLKNLLRWHLLQWLGHCLICLQRVPELVARVLTTHLLYSLGNWHPERQEGRGWHMNLCPAIHVGDLAWIVLCQCLISSSSGFVDDWGVGQWMEDVSFSLHLCVTVFSLLCAFQIKRKQKKILFYHGCLSVWQSVCDAY